MQDVTNHLNNESTVDDVRQWLANMHSRALLFHLDDPAAECLDRHGLSDETIQQIQVQADRAYQISDDAGVDVFMLYPGM